MSRSLDTGDTRMLIDACLEHGLLRNQCAYVLATAIHETAGTMKPVRETLASTDAKAKEILTKSWKAGKLPWVKSDYWSSGYFGRGYVQLTHKANYELAGRKLGIPLSDKPSLALEAVYAAPILVIGMKEGWFTGKKLADYITLSSSDFRGARRIVNGTDKADQIAIYARQYDALLKEMGYGVEPAPAPKPVLPLDPGTVVAVVPEGPEQPSKNGFVAWVIDVFLAIFGRKER